MTKFKVQLLVDLEVEASDKDAAIDESTAEVQDLLCRRLGSQATVKNVEYNTVEEI